MNIIFSSHAKTDLLEIVRYISNDKPLAAKKWANSIKDSINKLERFPRLGRVVPEYSVDSIREIIKGQYRIVYKIDEKQNNIVIIAIHHSKRTLLY